MHSKCLPFRSFEWVHVPFLIPILADHKARALLFAPCGPASISLAGAARAASCSALASLPPQDLAPSVASRLAMGPAPRAAPRLAAVKGPASWCPTGPAECLGPSADPKHLETPAAPRAAPSARAPRPSCPEMVENEIAEECITILNKVDYTWFKQDRVHKCANPLSNSGA